MPKAWKNELKKSNKAILNVAYNYINMFIFDLISQLKVRILK